MEVVEQVTVFFVMVLALALLTERFVEMVKVFFDYLDYRLGWDSFWSKRAARLHLKLKDKLGFMQRVKPELQDKTLERYMDRTLNQSGAYQGKTILIAGDLLRVIFIRVAAKCIGICFGIWLAYRLQIDLFAYINNSTDTAPLNADAANRFDMKIFASGFAIGLGAGPVHKIITSIERARKKKTAKGAT